MTNEEEAELIRLLWKQREWLIRNKNIAEFSKKMYVKEIEEVLTTIKMTR